MHILIAIICIGILIFVHELGHFVAARLCGVAVTKFAIGFPPKVLSWTRKGITYALNLIPLGGYVSIAGFSGDISSPDTPTHPNGKLFDEVHWIKKIIIVLAGIFMNVLFAYILFVVVFVRGITIPIVNMSEDLSAHMQNPMVQVAVVAVDTPAESAGLLRGDQVIAITDNKDNRIPLTTEALRDTVVENNGAAIVFTVLRNDKREIIVVTPTKSSDDTYRLGMALDTYGTVKVSFFKSLGLAGMYTWDTIKMIFTGLGMFIGSLFSSSDSVAQVSGPLGIVKETGNVISYGFGYLLAYMAMLSVDLAVLNILPIPPLDGWHAVRVIFRAIFRCDMPKIIESIITYIGIGLILALVVYATVGDVKAFF